MFAMRTGRSGTFQRILERRRLSQERPRSEACRNLLGSGDPGSGTASVVLNWVAASGVAPAFTGAATASLAAPFTFTGIFNYPINPPTEPPASLSLLGSGTATVNLAWHTDGYWIFENARYEFQSASAVPEPGTLLLIGAGAVTALVQRRRLRPVSGS